MEWLTVPIQYCDLPLSSQLAITIWDLAGPGKAVPFGGTTVSLFENDKCVPPHSFPSATTYSPAPSNLKKGRQKCKIWLAVEADGLSDTTTPSTVASNSEMDRLEKLFKKHELSELPRLDWLDNLAFRQIERVNKQSSSSVERKNEHYLFIEFPRFDFPVVYSDYEYTSSSSLNAANSSISPTASSAPPTQRQTPQSNPDTGGTLGFSMCVYDPEITRDNPAESKHRRLVRSHRNGPLDRDLKPNSKIRDELNEILNYSPTHDLTSEEKDLLWKFRFYLTRDKRGLTKFLKSVAWDDSAESKQAVQLLAQWTEIDVDDALELLGPGFENISVRAYAVDRLHKADDDELQLYLLQLVQALKFERIRPDPNAETSTDSSLANFLINRACANVTLGNFFYWYLMVETEDTNQDYKRLFSKVAWEFQVALGKTDGGEKRRATIKRQADFVFMIGEISKEIQGLRESRPKKVERLKQLLANGKNELAAFEPVPLPLDPGVTVVGCFPGKSVAE